MFKKYFEEANERRKKNKEIIKEKGLGNFLKEFYFGDSNTKQFSFMGFIFSLLYFSGKNFKLALKISVIYLIICFIVDLLCFNLGISWSVIDTVLLLGISLYCATTVVKETSFKNKTFNWKNFGLFIPIYIVLLLIFAMLTPQADILATNNNISTSTNEKQKTNIKITKQMKDVDWFISTYICSPKDIAFAITGLKMCYDVGYNTDPSKTYNILAKVINSAPNDNPYTKKYSLIIPADVKKLTEYYDNKFNWQVTVDDDKVKDICKRLEYMYPDMIRDFQISITQIRNI